VAKHPDINKVLIIGSGPIIIGQACEFDYSGTQACKALRALGYQVVLVNSNPATIMTDPGMADATYIEPLNVEALTRIIEKERPDAVLPNLGGQTGLNLTSELAKAGVFERFKVRVIGVKLDAIERGEDRIAFKDTMNRLGIEVPKSTAVYTVEEAERVSAELGYPVVVRPAYTMGGTGGGLVYNVEELRLIASRGIAASMINQVLIEESVLGWEELELEVVRDAKNQMITVCFIENVDAMGVHTGDSYCTAPMLTIKPELQARLQDYSYRIVQAIEVIGGTNVQFAHDPKTDRVVAIEINPRTSRSSALASKATGFPIAKIAAKLAVGYTLDEITNDITRETYASFEPSIDYCVVKIPRWTFEKFPEAEDILSTAMKSVGETMAIGRTFKEAFQKGMRSLEIGCTGFGAGKKFNHAELRQRDLEKGLHTPNSQRLFFLYEALKRDMPIADIYRLSAIDPWFLRNLKQITDLELVIQKAGFSGLDHDLLLKAKQYGFADQQLAFLTGTSADDIRELRDRHGVQVVYKLVDTCAAEFEAFTPYYYSTYEEENEARPSDKRKVMILGGGPNRIGQGIEFDYCCVHAAFALEELGIESIMVNSNPETVSTDYDTSDKLYFEPLTIEDVLNIIKTEKPEGVIVQFGGQTPLNLANGLHKAGVKILGTSVDSIDRAEDRQRFQQFLQKLGLVQPENGTARTPDEALAIAEKIHYPVVVRPSYVLGGRAMRIVYNQHDLKEYMRTAIEVSSEHPILVDKFLKDAVEIDVDAISDGENTVLGAIMQHIEEAGIHSGDSACVLPPHSLSPALLERIKAATKAMALELKVIGLMNIQYAVKDDVLYVLEVNPRASRTAPFVSKATGVPLAKLATKVMMGKKLPELGLTTEVVISHYAVKEAVFPFDRFANVDTLLGPEMKSTGEVMGVDYTLGLAFAKAQLAAGQKIPTSGSVLISVRNNDKPVILATAQKLTALGFKLLATANTAQFLTENSVECTKVNKISEGRPHILDMIKDKKIQWIINTSMGTRTTEDSYTIRRSALDYHIPYTTTTAGAEAMTLAITTLTEKSMEVQALQDYFK